MSPELTPSVIPETPLPSEFLFPRLSVVVVRRLQSWATVHEVHLVLNVFFSEMRAPYNTASPNY